MRYVRFFGAGVFGAILLFNLWGAMRLQPKRAFDSPYYNRLPDSLDPLIAFLDENGVTHIWTDVGIAPILMFKTQEKILAADYYDSYIAGGLIRFPDVLAEVEAAGNVVFVEPVSSQNPNPPIEQAFEAAGIDYEIRFILPELAVYIPTERIDPAVIASGLG
ncbi:MAG TPA: hypothetical protein VJZ27_17170, partial [Aggregatilineales bacterium]|nr:hypothetical protein [Aggregatilineales bacterium]